MNTVKTEAELLATLQQLPSRQRRLIAIAGAPASGKSTLATRLADGLNPDCKGRAAVVSMDGFHFDDGLLEARGYRARKGAPHTFDVAGLRHMLARLKARNEPEVVIPVFDRDIEIARAGAAVLPQAVEIVIVEGNYLLLDQTPWDSLRELFDLTVALVVSEHTLRERLHDRWAGYNMTDDEITVKLEENDLPNGRLVISDSCDADVVVQSI